jgi:hypothetical protein
MLRECVQKDAHYRRRREPGKLAAGISFSSFCSDKACLQRAQRTRAPCGSIKALSSPRRRGPSPNQCTAAIAVLFAWSAAHGRAVESAREGPPLSLEKINQEAAPSDCIQCRHAPGCAARRAPEDSLRRAGLPWADSAVLVRTDRPDRLSSRAGRGPVIVTNFIKLSDYV